jgi:hypothetical protein
VDVFPFPGESYRLCGDRAAYDLAERDSRNLSQPIRDLKSIIEKIDAPSERPSELLGEMRESISSVLYEVRSSVDSRHLPARFRKQKCGQESGIHEQANLIDTRMRSRRLLTDSRELRVFRGQLGRFAEQVWGYNVFLMSISQTHLWKSTSGKSTML